jgi:hypothetical protein
LTAWPIMMEIRFFTRLMSIVMVLWKQSTRTRIYTIIRYGSSLRIGGCR